MQPDGKTVVVGYFDTFGGAAANHLVRLKPDGSPDPTFTVAAGTYGPLGNGYANRLLVLPTGKILVAGRFDNLNGAPTNSLLQLNADGSLDASFQPALPTGSVATDVVVQPNGSLVVAGDFGNGRVLLRLLATGGLDAGFTAPASLREVADNRGTPVALLPNGQLLVCGNFGSSWFARLNSDGSLDTSFALSAPPSGALSAVGVQANGDIWLAGANLDHQFGGFEGPLASFNSAGTLQPGFNPRPQIEGYVQAVVRQPGGDLLVGGSFTEWNGQPVHNLVCLSSAGTLNPAFTAAAGSLPGRVTALALQPDGQVLAGTTHGLRRLAANGTPDAGFSCFLGELAVSALAVQPDGRILLGWNYGAPNSYNYLVRLTSTGAQDASFGRAASNGGTGAPMGTTALLVQGDGRIIVGGWHNRTSGSGRYVLRYLADGAADPTFTPANFWGGTTGVETIFSLLQQPDGKLLVAGLFKNAGSRVSAGVARLGTNGLPDPAFAPPTTPYTGPAYTVALQPNGRILAGGNFNFTGGRNLPRLLADGQLDASFSIQNPPNGPVNSLLVQPDGGIVVGGAFTTLTGQPARYLARLTAPNVLAVAAPGTVAAATTAWPVPAHGVLHVQPDASAHPLGAELLDALGRVVRQQALAGPGGFSFDVQGLPAGLYVLRVRYAEGAVSRPLSVE